MPLRPIAVALVLTLASPADAAVITVDTNVDGSLAGHCTLRDAIEAANGDSSVTGCIAGSGADVIEFSAEVETIELTSAAGGMLTITAPLSIDGAGVLRTISRNAEDSAFRILRTTPETSLTLHWMKIAGGLADALTPERGGAGILAWGPLSLRNSEVSGNLTDAQYGRGGGINAHETLELVDSVVTGNATTNQDASGGGVYAYANATFVSSVISNNATAGVVAFGGGIASYPGNTLTFTDSLVTRNFTFGDASFGGGIFALGGLELNYSTVSENSTMGNDSGGGGGYAYALTSIGSTISGNSTVGDGSAGGGFFTASAILTNSTVSGNATNGKNAPGGGILFGLPLQANNSTITDNTAAQSAGGGLFAFAFGPTATNVDSTIVYGNTGAEAGNIAFLDPDADLVISGAHNLVGDVGTNVALPDDTLACDPLVQALAANGGTTRTHALGAGSCAIDAGSNDAALAFDQRGEPYLRVVGLAPDIGSIEEQPMIDVVFVDGFEP